MITKLTQQQHADLLFLLFSSNEQALYSVYKQTDYASIEQQNTDFYYTHMTTIDNLQALKQVKRNSKTFTLTFLYRSQQHWYDTRTGMITHTYYDAAKQNAATHIEVVLRKKQLDKATLTEYKQAKKYHYEQYLLYKHKLATRTR